LFHLEFGNLFIHLSDDELIRFKDYVESIEPNFYLIRNKEAQNRRKLMLSIGSKKIFFALYANEFAELRELLSLRKKNDIIRNTEIIGHEMIFN